MPLGNLPLAITPGQAGSWVRGQEVLQVVRGLGWTCEGSQSPGRNAPSPHPLPRQASRPGDLACHPSSVPSSVCLSSSSISFSTFLKPCRELSFESD